MADTYHKTLHDLRLERGAQERAEVLVVRPKCPTRMGTLIYVYTGLCKVKLDNGKYINCRPNEVEFLDGPTNLEASRVVQPAAEGHGVVPGRHVSAEDLARFAQSKSPAIEVNPYGTCHSCGRRNQHRDGNGRCARCAG